MPETRTLAWGGAGLVALVLVAGYLWINRPYGEVSERSYEYATALFSACNQKDTARLHKISEMLRQSIDADEISQQEASWLQAIIDLGLSGSWAAASQEVRELMEDQLQPVALSPVTAGGRAGLQTS